MDVIFQGRGLIEPQDLCRLLCMGLA